jgi:dTMP kinase
VAQGKLIVFEGLDGSGLTTQADLLRNWFFKRGVEAYLTKEPTDGPAGAMIRLALANRLTSGMRQPGGRLSAEAVDDHALALLFAADRLDHLAGDILPKLDSGIHVICDRYYLSSYAYQGLTAELEWLRAINSKCRKPDLTIFFDVPVAICKKRMDRQRWHVELYEDPERLEKVRHSYVAAIQALTFEGDQIETVSGTRSVQEVHRAVVSQVRKILSKALPASGLQVALLPEAEASATVEQAQGSRGYMPT